MTGDYQRLFEASPPYLLNAGNAADIEPVAAIRTFAMSLSVQCAEEAPFSEVVIGEGLQERALNELALFEWSCATSGACRALTTGRTSRCKRTPLRCC